MILLADESIDKPIVDKLRVSGHTVSYIAESEPSLHDEGVLLMANKSNAVLLTADKDFGELVFRQRKTTNGVILIRLAGFSSKAKSEIVAEAIEQYGSNMQGSFTVVTRGAIRTRKHPPF